jgi:glycosyltransferase involved in cell wall biosynthesis
MHRSVGFHDLKSLSVITHFFNRQIKFDVIHSHSSKAGALARIAGLLSRKKSAQVYSPHAFYTMSENASAIYGKIERWLSKISDAIITVSPLEQQHAINDLKIAADKVHIVINGVDVNWKTTRDLAKDCVSEISKIDKNAYIIGFVGRLVAQKNPLLLINSFIKIIAEKPNSHLLMLGEGEMKEEIISYINQNNLSDNVTLLSGYDARNIMPAFDCLLCSSDYEGFAVVFLEALAAGVPIITTNVGGANEAVIQNKTGIVVNEFTAQALANAVLQFANLSEEHQAEFRSNSKEHAKNFSIENMARNTYEVYEAAINNKN